MQKCKQYIYDGPVMSFGRYIAWFKGITMAESERKAKSNLMYQFRRKNGLGNTYKLEFTDNVQEVSNVDKRVLLGL